MSASCLVNLAALVITFKGPASHANFSSKAISSNSDDLSSFVLQFKTSQANTRIASVADHGAREMFAVDIQRGYLQIVYNLNGTGNSTLSIPSYLVNTNKWFLLNISSETNNTLIRLTKSDRATSSPCAVDFNTTVNITLLGKGFQNLFTRTGMTIGGETSHEHLKPFNGCMGKIELGRHPVVLFNRSQENVERLDMHFAGYSSGISDGCPCGSGQGSCENENGVYVWDQTQGGCVCKCSKDYQGTYCNSTLKSNDDEVDKKFVYLVAGLIGGLIVLLGCVVCVFLYCKRTAGASFGVYNPKSEEQMQGQQMNTKIEVPVPEKLI